MVKFTGYSCLISSFTPFPSIILNKHHRLSLNFCFNNSSKSRRFSVSAQNFTLISEPQLGNGSVVKEYSLNITSNKLVLTFTPSAYSFAFINALEVFSIPDT